MNNKIKKIVSIATLGLMVGAVVGIGGQSVKASDGEKAAEIVDSISIESEDVEQAAEIVASISIEAEGKKSFDENVDAKTVEMVKSVLSTHSEEGQSFDMNDDSVKFVSEVFESVPSQPIEK